MNTGKIRPQILVAILCATIFSISALYIGMNMEATEIVTAVIGGIFGFLGGVSLKVLENE
jgi:LytS/YehU family sensor histidine kinase